jgi:hypothetical protein
VPAGRPVEAPISVDPPPADDAAGLISAEELAAAAGHFGTGNSTTPTTVPRQAVELAADLPSSSSEGPSPTSIMIIALGVVAGSILASPVRRALFVSAVPQSSISHRGFSPAGALDVLDIPPPYAAEDRAPKARPEKPARAQRPAKAEKPARAKKPSRARHAATTTARLRRATPVRRPRSASHRPVLTPQAAITVASVWHNPSASSQPCGCSYCSTS